MKYKIIVESWQVPRLAFWKSPVKLGEEVVAIVEGERDAYLEVSRIDLLYTWQLRIEGSLKIRVEECDGTEEEVSFEETVIRGMAKRSKAVQNAR